MMHILNNLSEAVDEQVIEWEWFWTSLKKVEALLSNEDRRRWLWESCVKQSRFSHARAAFMAGTPALYRKRWSVVHFFLDKARPLLHMLRTCWSVQAFDRHGPDRDDAGDDMPAFSSLKFTETLESN